jgi:outer membrane lipase/esterase
MRSHHQLFSPLFFVLLTLSWLFIPADSLAKKKPFDRIVVFGTSLSDSGNAFIINANPTFYGFGGCDLGTAQNVPPYDTLDEWLIPDGVYARGGHHVTNGATWIEQYARGQGLAGTTRPALRSAGAKASNYAVGGARSYDYPCRFNLQDQLNAYLDDFPQTSSKALVVIETGSNDVRDALVAPTDEDRMIILQTVLTNIATSIQTLYGHGARNFLVLNIPAIDKTPAIRQIDAQVPGTAWFTEQIVQGLNIQLGQIIEGLRGYPQIIIKQLDIYTLLNDIVAQPANYGIITTDTACVTPNIQPYTCAQPNTYLFWDGIHPTKAVHAIVAQKASELLQK